MQNYGLNNGNKRSVNNCPYCWCVLYSKGALTRHIRSEHWEEEPHCETMSDGYKCGKLVKEWGDNCIEHSGRR